MGTSMMLVLDQPLDFDVQTFVLFENEKVSINVESCFVMCINYRNVVDEPLAPLTMSMVAFDTLVAEFDASMMIQPAKLDTNS